jgi:2,3-bisphosphoglycerate-dependent phosphoglycerate mutase
MFNDKELFSGDVDIPLTEEGTMEAIAGGKTYAHIDFDIIITSRLVRARMTALLAMTQNASGQVPIHVRGGLEGAPGPEVGRQKLRENALLAIDKAECDMVPLYSQKDLNERCYGDLQGLNKRQAAETFGDDVVRKWRRSVDTRPPGGESLHDTAIRSRAFFKDFVLPRLSAGQNVLLVAHGNSLRSVIAYVAGLTEEESIRLQLATAAPIMYNYDGEKFSHTNHQSKWKLDKPQFLTSTLKLSHGDSLV